MKWLGGSGLWYQRDDTQLWINWVSGSTTEYEVRQRLRPRKIIRAAGPFDTLEQAKVAFLMLRSLHNDRTLQSNVHL